MRNGKNDYAIAFWAVEKREGEILENDPSGIRNRRRTGERKSYSPCGCFFDSMGKAGAEARLRLAVESDFGKKLSARFCDKACLFHWARRLASANTSSAR